MPLVANDLGDKLDTAAQAWNNIAKIEDADLAEQRKQFWRAIAKEIVDYIKANAKLTVPGTGLVAPSGGGPVTGSSITGTIS